MKTFLRGILFEENRTGWHYVFGSIAFLVLAAFFFWDEYPVVGMIASVAAIIGAPIDYLIPTALVVDRFGPLSGSD